MKSYITLEISHDADIDVARLKRLIGWTARVGLQNLADAAQAGLELKGISLEDADFAAEMEVESVMSSLIDLLAAAPDLYEACVAALAYLAPPASKFEENREVAAEMIRKAIAKAEGRA